MNKFLYSEGTMQTSVNNEIIDNKSYKFEYDGNEGKGFVKNNDDSYYIELDNSDFEKIFKQNSKQEPANIEQKLKNILNKKSKSKSKTKKTRKSLKKSKTLKSKSSKSNKSQSRTLTTKSQKPKSQSRTLTTKSQKPKSKSKTSKKKSKSKKTTRKSKGSLKKTNKMPLETNFLNTII